MVDEADRSAVLEWYPFENNSSPQLFTINVTGRDTYTAREMKQDPQFRKLRKYIVYGRWGKILTITSEAPALNLASQAWNSHNHYLSHSWTFF